jgi:TIGR03009 family protein
MFKWIVIAIGVLACAAPLSAQSSEISLDEHLRRWDEKAKTIESLVGACIRTDVDKTFQTTRVYEGTIQFLKPDKAILELKNKQKPEITEKYVWIDPLLYHYLPERKAILVHEVANTEGNLLVSLFFGVKLENLKRYDLKLSKEGAQHVYIDIRPKLPADRADFARAQVVLTKKMYRTSRVWLEQPNGNEVTWEFPKTERNGRVDRTLLVKPEPPPGWTLGRTPRIEAGPDGSLRLYLRD